MIIQYWSDFSCPFCYIAEARLMKALDNLGINEQCRLDFRSFRLNPAAKKVPSHPIFDSYAKRYGPDMAAMQIERIESMAAGEGLEFHYGTALNSNTMDAHRLVKHIKSKDRKKADELIHCLYNAFFRDNRVLADHEVLKDIATGIGIDAAEVDSVLNGRDYRSDVEADENVAHRYGVTAVPFFLVNGKYGIHGAVDVSEFEQVLKKAIDEEDAMDMTGSVCGPDGCH
ncbi:MAG: DsbA family oxidoreductase [Candidatus Methanomethylophilaceae archaeon]|nr:DsbA family oxidoreductase [Candidatus Methanomethylophilaceae archaeon]